MIELGLKRLADMGFSEPIDDVVEVLKSLLEVYAMKGNLVDVFIMAPLDERKEVSSDGLTFE